MTTYKKILLGIILLTLLIPYPSVTIPEWRINVIDRNGNSLPRMEVIQNWSHSRILGESRDMQISDEQGYVTFPPRKLICPVFLRVIFRATDFLNYLFSLHGSPSGGYSTIMVNKQGTGLLIYREGEELKNTIVVRIYE